MKIFFKIALICSILIIPACASIVNTKHNLSITGTGSVKATVEAEICVFCHVPHNTRQISPLWNRETPITSYTMYDSPYLQRTGYPVPADLSSVVGEPGAKSRMCMSCHDGTIAVGAVYKLRYTILGDTIDMQGVEGIGTILATSAAYIGSDLTNHHPVGYKYDSTGDTPKTFDVGGSTTTELKATPDSPIKLSTYADGDYVECVSCHEPHADNKMFLRVDTKPSHGENVVATCTSCHEKNGWVGSAHQTATNTYSDPDVMTKYGVNSVAELGCINCHTPHNGGGTPSLLRKVEQNTCFQGAASSIATAPCHGTSGAKDIQTPLNKAYAHPVMTIDGVHTGLDALYGEGNTESDSEPGKGLDWATSKHAECMDCHNPHQAKTGNFESDPSGWYPANPSETGNLVSPALTGVMGVEPESTPRFTQPTNFTTLKVAEKEYQICFKCHSYWGLGAVNAYGESVYDTISHFGEKFTDQANEFNPNNKAVHPVRNTLNNQTGSYEPRALRTSFLKAPWNQNVGNQTMTCTDCHGNDTEGSGDPRGPHGSNSHYMLKGVNQSWPRKPDGTYYIRRGIREGTYAAAGGDDLFCMNCHVLDCTDSSDFGTYNAHCESGRSVMLDPACVNCHIAVPHGSAVSRMIGYREMPPPYNTCDPSDVADLPFSYYNPTTGTECSILGEGFQKKQLGTAYKKDNFYSNHNDCAGGHDKISLVYDEYP